MASMTKPILATGILKLKEEGKLNLSDKISKYIPSYKSISGDSITIEHLLRHQSGYNGRQIWRENSQMAQYPNLQAAIKVMSENPPELKLGTEEYSSLNSALLTEIMNVAAGMPAEDYLKVKIIEPLQMKDTYLLDDTSASWYKRVASTYEFNKETAEVSLYWDPQRDTTLAPYFRGGVGALSTATDYAKFLQMWLNKGILNGVRILQEETVNQALDNKGKYFGLHWAIPTGPMNGDMPGFFGHRGWYGTSASVYTKDKAIVIHLTQTYNNPMAKEFHDLLAKSDLFMHEGPYEMDMDLISLPESPSNSELKKFTGTYEATTPDSLVWTATIFEKGNQLYSSISSTADSWTDELVYREYNIFSPGSMYGKKVRGIYKEVTYQFNENGFDFVVLNNVEFSFKKK
jgi:CubicO group peptidase (beta-lactamase class C family)